MINYRFLNVFDSVLKSRDRCITEKELDRLIMIIDRRIIELIKKRYNIFLSKHVQIFPNPYMLYLKKEKRKRLFKSYYAKLKESNPEEAALIIQKLITSRQKLKLQAAQWRESHS